MHPSLARPLLLIAACAAAGDCAATLVVTADNRAVNSQEAFAASVLSSDLVNAGQPTLASVSVSNYSPFSEFGYSASNVDAPDFALNNGILGQPTSNGPTMAGGAAAFSLTDSWSVTFSLDLSLSPSGYDLATISTHTAHYDNRTSQSFVVRVEFVGDPGAWVSLGAFESEGPTGHSNQAHQLVLGSDVAPGVTPFALGVSAIRFDIRTYDNGSVWREIDVTGAASSIPEPSSSVWIAGVAALGGVALRRRLSRQPSS